ncbi:hypothetical protein L210DRAFT_948146, partial [Boletus edulis BED1]
LNNTMDAPWIHLITRTKDDISSGGNMSARLRRPTSRVWSNHERMGLIMWPTRQRDRLALDIITGSSVSLPSAHRCHRDSYLHWSSCSNPSPNDRERCLVPYNDRNSERDQALSVPGSNTAEDLEVVKRHARFLCVSYPYHDQSCDSMGKVTGLSSATSESGWLKRTIPTGV